MTERKLFLWLAILAVLTGGAVWHLTGQDASTDSKSASLPLAFPQLAGNLGRVQKIVISDATATTTLARQGDTWVSETFGGFPADPATVRQFLYGVTQLQLAEAKTANPKLFGRLGLSAPEASSTNGTEATKHKAGDSRAVRVQLLDSTGKALADYQQGDAPAVDGPAGTGKGAFYFLRAGDSQAWLARKGQRAEADPATWIGKDLVNIDQERVQELTVTATTGETLTVYRNTPLEKSFQIRDVKGTDADKAKAAQPMADALGSLFAFVRFEAVQPRGKAQLTGTPYRVRLVTFDGLEVELSQYDTGKAEEGAAGGATSGKTTWAVFAAKTVPVAKTAADWQKELPKGERELPLKTTELVAAEAKAINDLGAAWVVRLQDFKANRLRQAPLAVQGAMPVGSGN